MPRIKCPICGYYKTIPIQYGYPMGDAVKRAEEGKVRLGGCTIVVGENRSPDRYCPKCRAEFTHWSDDFREMMSSNGDWEPGAR